MPDSYDKKAAEGSQSAHNFGRGMDGKPPVFFERGAMPGPYFPDVRPPAGGGVTAPYDFGARVRGCLSLLVFPYIAALFLTGGLWLFEHPAALGAAAGLFVGYWIASICIVALLDLVHRYAPLPWRSRAELECNGLNAFVGRSIFTVILLWIGYLWYSVATLSQYRWSDVIWVLYAETLVTVILGVAMAEWVAGRSARLAALVLIPVAAYEAYTLTVVWELPGYDLGREQTIITLAVVGTAGILALIADIRAKHDARPGIAR
jgi:hypothetical protein